MDELTLIALPSKLVCYLILELQLPTHLAFHLNARGFSKKDLVYTFQNWAFAEVLKLLQSAGFKSGWFYTPSDGTKEIYFHNKLPTYVLALKYESLCLYTDKLHWDIKAEDDIIEFTSPGSGFCPFTHQNLEDWLQNIKKSIS